MQRPSNKHSMYPVKKPKLPQTTIPITLQEPKEEKFNLLRQSQHNNLYYTSEEELLTHQKQVEVDTNQNNDIIILNNQIQENIIDQSEEERLKYLITNNNNENITFINTLLRLKGKLNNNINTPSSPSVNNNNNNNNITEISIANGMILKPDDESKSYIKELIDICEHSSPSYKPQVQSNDTLTSLQIPSTSKINNNICHSPNTITTTSKDFTPRKMNHLTSVYNKTILTTTGRTQNTTTPPQYNKHSGLKRKDLIEITNRRKLMTESNNTVDNTCMKKGCCNVNEIKNIPCTLQMNHGYGYQQISNETIELISQKKFPNELLKEENIHMQSSGSSFWGNNQLFHVQNKETPLVNLVSVNSIEDLMNNNNINEREYKDKDEYNINVVSNKDNLLYVNNTFENESTLHHQEQHKQKIIKINLKEIKERIKNENENEHLINIPQPETQSPTSINKQNISPSNYTNNSIVIDMVNYGSNNPGQGIQDNNEELLKDTSSIIPFHPLNNNDNNNNNSFQIIPNDFIISVNTQNMNFNVEDSALTNDSNMKTTKTHFYDSMDGDSKIEEFDMLTGKKQNESREIKFSQIKKHINNSINIDNKNISSINLSKLTNFADYNSNETNMSNYPSKKYFTPKSNYYGNLLGQSQTNNNINSCGGSYPHVPIPLPHQSNKNSVKNSKNVQKTESDCDKYELNKIKLKIIDEEDKELYHIHQEDINNDKECVSDDINKEGEMLTAKIDLFDDDEDDDDDDEEFPEKKVPNKVQQNKFNVNIINNEKSNSSLIIKENSNNVLYETSNRLTKENKNEMNVNNLCSQHNRNEQISFPITNNDESRSFCVQQCDSSNNSNHIGKVINQTLSNNNSKELQTEKPKTIDISTNVNTSNKIIHNKSKSINSINNQNKKKDKFEPKKVTIDNSKGTCSSKTNENKNTTTNLITKTSPIKPKQTEPTNNTSFKNIFIQQPKIIPQRINTNTNNNNNNNRECSYLSSPHKSVKYQQRKQKHNSQSPLLTQENKLLSIINTSEIIAESIINSSAKKNNYKHVMYNNNNLQKYNYSNTPTKNKITPSSYMVTNIVKDQLRIQLESQEKSRKKISNNLAKIKRTQDQHVKDIKANIQTFNINESDLEQSKSFLAMKVECDKELDSFLIK